MDKPNGKCPVTTGTRTKTATDVKPEQPSPAVRRSETREPPPEPRRNPREHEDARWLRENGLG
jgi:hypothetical protein